MRVLFFLAVLANVGFALWYLSAPPGSAEGGGSSGQPLEGGELRLLAELPEGLLEARRAVTADREPAATDDTGKAETKVEESGGEPAREAVTPTPVAAEEAVDDVATSADLGVAQGKGPADGPAARCFRFDGLESRRAVEGLKAALQNAGGDLLKSGEAEETSTNYWVLVPPLPNRERANKLVTRLQEAKIKDFYIVRGGEYINAISLGVFSTREAAQRRFDQVKKVGKEFQYLRLQELSLVAKRHWVLWQVELDPAGWEAYEAGIKGIAPAWQGVDCPRTH